MSYEWNADELFQVGVEVEKNGREFYLAAEQKAPTPEFAKLCRELAHWEEAHIALFESLRAALPPEAFEGGAFDPDSETGAYVRATADGHVFRRGADVAAHVDRCKTPADFLDVALSFEKDSVVFYSAMKQVVAASQGRAKVDALIEEELRHIAILTREKAKLPR